MKTIILGILLFLASLNLFAQKLPINGLCLTDVLAVTDGSCLADAFSNANPNYFDPTYAVPNGNFLDDFRNYGPRSCVRPNGLSTALYIYRTACNGSDSYFTGSYAAASQAAWDISNNSANCSPSGYTGCQAFSFAINDTLYHNESGPDCSYVSDGYYLITAYQGYPPNWSGVFSWPLNVYHVVSGKIVQITQASVASIPTVNTGSISLTGITSASVGGSISSDGGASVTAKGICYNTSANPTISNSHTSNGTGNTSFTGYLSGLDKATTYHVRAYATNSVGTGYGNDDSFISYDLPYTAATLQTLSIAGNIQNLNLTFTTTNPTESTNNIYMKVKNVTRSSGWITTSGMFSYAEEWNVSHSVTLAMGVSNYSGDIFDMQFSIDNGATWSADLFIVNDKILPYDINQ